MNLPDMKPGDYGYVRCNHTLTRTLGARLQPAFVAGQNYRLYRLSDFAYHPRYDLGGLVTDEVWLEAALLAFDGLDEVPAEATEVWPDVVTRPT